ncbi:MAG: hypothetical protein M9962_08025 [Oligoflexia bacterium]|nr:hypothetical protein [Oligoflexia bacterium]
MKALTQKLAIISLLLTFLASNAFAATVWNYRLQPSGAIKGGKLKISKVKTSSSYVQLKLKYKLETSIGYKEDWLPYNFPGEMLDKDYLSRLPLNEAKSLGRLPHAFENRTVNFQITRKSSDAFLVKSDDGQFLIYTKSSGGAWRRIEFVIRSSVTITLKGNLENVVNE